MSTGGGEGLPGAVARLRDEVADVRLPLDLPDADEARRTRRELVAQLDDYLLPRLRRPEAPLLAVVGGSTGAGRSTLVNSLVGREVSPAGVLRPTTRVPVLVCRAADRQWFAGTRVLPGLRRVAGGPRPADEGPALVLHVDDRVPEGLAVLDAPDIDSVATANRELAVRLLGAADVWLFVTTAARYADAVPWHLLHIARERTAELAIVLNRVPEDALDEVRPHYRTLLANAGLGEVPLFTLPETPLHRRMLTRDQIGPVRNWLYGRATDPYARDAAVRRTLGGAVGSLAGRAGVVGRAAGRQHEAAAALTVCVDRAYAAARRHVDGALRGGALLTGGILARWRAWSAADLPDAAVPELERALVDGVEGLLRDVVERVAGLTEVCWRGRPGGLALLGTTRASAPDAASDVVPDGALDAVSDAVPDAASVVSDVVSDGALDVVSDAVADTVARWHDETAARVREARALEDGRDGASGRARATVLLMVAALAGAAHDDGDAGDAGDSGARARAALPAELVAAVEPVRAAIRAHAADLLDAERERHMGAVCVLRTEPGTGLDEAADAIRRAG